ncbi:zf-TFIIB domain-containing protein [Sporolactobacillus sp. THM19-2]|uniref:TFIIB-type zinc ribbon-containing protein n=1 Tax=Sporolactobacillus sp. THM19-2 TaxID=2511171 RepID=UPI00101F5ACB|nr:zf-TFIIB domain-containing protein [Sporolactobacillus sp. THM19-2]RYL94484.1 hypothetical protein EWH91_00410 [Sporolactobacillus sp. THM19-2]
MNCPVCEDVRMKEVEKDGVLIDLCPNCKGVWLDRGELDKISRRVREVREPFNEWYDHDDDFDDHYDRRDSRDYKRYDHDHYDDRRKKGYYPRRKKKKSVMDMLGDIFD